MTDQELFQLCNDILLYKEGDLYWKKTRRGSALAFTKAGGLHPSSFYKTITVMDKKYYQHRIIFLMHNGYFPTEVDHIDGNKLNNKIENLRAATTKQNQWNSKKPITNTSGYKGVSWHKNKNNWISSITLFGKLKYLGSFKTAEQAHEAYKQAAIKHFGEFARF
jgi:hypothetical protein